MAGADKGARIHSIVKMLWHFCLHELTRCPSVNIVERENAMRNHKHISGLSPKPTIKNNSLA